MQHARCGAIGKRLLRDQLGRQVVVEVGDQHDSIQMSQGFQRGNYTGSVPSESQLRRSIVEIGNQLHTAGFVAGTEGNISARLDAKKILVTPTGISKREMKPADLVIVDLSGQR